MNDSTNKTAHFTSTSRIVDATVTDPTRRNLECVEVRTKDDKSVYLTATNSHILAVRIEEGNVEKTELVHKTIFSGKQRGDQILQSDGNWLNSETGKYINNEDDLGPYPDIAQVLPDNIEGYKVISFNADELYHLARALKDRDARDNGIVLLLPSENTKPIAVLPGGASGLQSFGLLMPMRIEGSEEEFNRLVKEYKQVLKGEGNSLPTESEESDND